jgi:HlyD family secretion protein
MATSTLPRRHGLSGRWLAAGIIFVVAAILVAVAINGAGQRASGSAPTTVQVTRGSLVASVLGSGNVAAEQSLNLAFQSAGTVASVLVKEGDVVQLGQILAKLDDRNLQLQVASSRSSLDSAQARLQQAQQGNARAEDLNAAKAQVASAQASFDKLNKGPAGTDQAAAQAAVDSAQAAYDAAVAAGGTSSSQFAASSAALQKAEANLRQAQANYDRIAGAPDAGRRPESLALQNATIDYQQAKANYDSLAQTVRTDAQSRIESAAAQLAQATANLAKLTPTSDDLTVARAGLDQAKANLAKLTASATATDLRIQQATVTQAEQALKQAELALDNAALKAPFAGIVTQINVVPGSTANSGAAALRLINRSPLHVDLKLTENDVAKVQIGQPVKVTIQSLGGWETAGRVSFIAPAAENINGIVTYVVRVSFPDSDAKVLIGMTADLSIEVARKDNVLLVPNTALLPKGTGRVVYVPSSSGAVDRSGQTLTNEVDVQVGVSDGTNTEIISGLSENQVIVALPNSSSSRASGPGGMFGGF